MTKPTFQSISQHCSQLSDMVLATLQILCNLRMNPISQSVTLQQAGKAWKGQTLQVIEPIRKLSNKDVQGPYSQHFILFVTCECAQYVKVFVLDRLFHPGLMFEGKLWLKIRTSYLKILDQAGKAFQGQTPQLVGLICKLQRKLSNVNAATVF